MKNKTNNKTKYIHVRLTPDEYEDILKLKNKYKLNTISDLIKNAVFERPMRIRHIDANTERLLIAFQIIQKQLIGVSRNYNQVVKHIHSANLSGSNLIQELKVLKKYAEDLVSTKKQIDLIISNLKKHHQ